MGTRSRIGLQLTIDWDPNDPRYAFLNEMTQDEMNAYFTRATQELITHLEAEVVAIPVPATV